jgi:multiple antibiotic resistance protein
MDNTTIHFLLVLLQSTVTLLIILDPFGLLPLVVGMTRQMSDTGRRTMMTQAVLAGMALLLVFTFGGNKVLGLFGVTTNDLRISGGILLLVIALSVVLKGHASSEMETDSTFGIVPIASPLLAGPGSITATIILVGSVGLLLTTLAVVIAFMITWVVLRSTTLVYRILGRSGSDVIARVMGILLAAIAVVYIRDGIFGILVARGLCGPASGP